MATRNQNVVQIICPLINIFGLPVLEKLPTTAAVTVLYNLWKGEDNTEITAGQQCL